MYKHTIIQIVIVQGYDTRIIIYTRVSTRDAAVLQPPHQNLQYCSRHARIAFRAAFTLIIHPDLRWRDGSWICKRLEHPCLFVPTRRFERVRGKAQAVACTIDFVPT